MVCSNRWSSQFLVIRLLFVLVFLVDISSFMLKAKALPCQLRTQFLHSERKIPLKETTFQWFPVKTGKLSHPQVGVRSRLAIRQTSRSRWRENATVKTVPAAASLETYGSAHRHGNFSRQGGWPRRRHIFSLYRHHRWFYFYWEGRQYDIKMKLATPW